MRCVLLDIEGTTTPVSFVYDVLFPFAEKNVSSFLDEHFEDIEVQAAISLLMHEHSSDVEAGLYPAPLENTAASLLVYLRWLMSQDRKSTGLKQIQGLIWKDGYESGALKGLVYPDVVPSLKSWREQGARLYVYSSGSVLAQKLLFGNSNEGNLLEHFCGHFDTTVGGKKESPSYEKIVSECGAPAKDFLFLSDVEEELDAARVAGMNTALIVREKKAPDLTSAHPIHRDFSSISLEP